jgi:quercetin dioxygenase-like cupin family protein
MSNYEVKNVEPVAVSNDVQVRVFTLACGDVIPWHYHRESTDHYFVLRGTLTIETRGPDNRCVLPVGERHKILPGEQLAIGAAGAMAQAENASLNFRTEGRTSRAIILLVCKSGGLGWGVSPVL